MDDILRLSVHNLRLAAAATSAIMDRHMEQFTYETEPRYSWDIHELKDVLAATERMAEALLRAIGESES